MPVQRPPPARDIVPSEEILQYIHPSLLHVDYNDTTVVACIVVVTTLSFSFMFFLSLYLCNFFHIFRALRLKHRVFMCLAIARAIYGLCGVVFGSYAIFTTTNLDRDMVFGKTATSAVAINITLGFFIFELISVVLSDLIFKSFSKMLIIHHSLAVIAYSLVILRDSNYSFGCKALILEMSTPFSCLCFVMLKSRMENSEAWKINQIILVHTFHLRSVVEFYMWYITYHNWSYIWEYMPRDVFALLYANLILVTFVMTPYWGYKKTQQLFNRVDWNFQESRDTTELTNGDLKRHHE